MVVRIRLPLHTMYEGELYRYANLLHIPDFRGVKMRDQLPKTTHSVESGILNLNTHLQNGSHWTCWYKKHDACYYFDSFGETPPIEIQQYLKTPAQYAQDLPIIRRSAVIVQRDGAQECGALCLYVLQKLGHGIEYGDILAELLHRYQTNDSSPLVVTVTT